MDQWQQTLKKLNRYYFTESNPPSSEDTFLISSGDWISKWDTPQWESMELDNLEVPTYPIEDMKSEVNYSELKDKWA